MASDGQLNRASEVIYQIYPSSFADSNGDGIGDINGITGKLDYIKKLGVDAIWISPIFLSPDGRDGDGGYAITDHRKIAERFGSMKDFEELLESAHKEGLRVYTDFVLCHTASDHEWFEKSRNRIKEPGANYEDRYIWHNGKGDHHHHGYPNNWKSVFNGPAWTWDSKRQEFFLHHFNRSQPALNLNNEAVQQAQLDEMKFWLDKGVDGLRLDALPFANYDPQFRSNPKKFKESGDSWFEQNFDHSMCQHEATKALVAKVRTLMHSYHPPKRGLGEVVAGHLGGENSMEQAAHYLDPKTGLDTCYTQSLVQFYNQYPPADRLRAMIRENISRSPDGGFCNNLGNHDFPRFASRMMGNTNPAHHAKIIKQLMSLAIALPGSFCMYQGEELGLSEAHVPRSKWKDEVGNPPRDGCRTPMPWEADAKNAGFSTSDDPYLPIADHHLHLSVDIQENQTGSMLQVTRRMLEQRRASAALKQGKAIVLPTDNSKDHDVVAFIRDTGKESVLCAFNMSDRAIDFDPAPYLKGVSPATLERLNLPHGALRLEAYDSVFEGLAPGKSEEVEVGMKAAPQFSRNGAQKNGATRIFAADMLFGDYHLPEAAVTSEGPFAHLKGKREAISRDTHEALLNGYDKVLTPGGATASSLWMLKKILKDKVKVKLMGFAADDEPGRVIKKFLKEADIEVFPKKWPEGVSQETAITDVIEHKDGPNTVLTCAGTEVEAFQKALTKRVTATELEEGIKHSDIVYLPESTLSKFGLPFTQKLLESRWRNHKELVLSLPSSASFGPDDSDVFKYLIPSCNVVMGNDMEFCRILDKETARGDISDEQMKRVTGKLQAAFKKAHEEKILEHGGIPVSEFGQVAFITRGSKHSGIIVTRDGAVSIPISKVADAKTKLGAGYASFAGFLTGYLQGLTHEQSAALGMGLASEKVRQEDPAPYLLNPEASLARVLDKDGAEPLAAALAQARQAAQTHARTH